MSKCGYCGTYCNVSHGPCPICGTELSKVIGIDRAKTHYVAFAMCIPCLNRWIATFTKDTNLFKLECRACGATESFASFVPDGYLKEQGK